ncbi:hypothetical protein [Haloplanus salilacus]|uniref:hypothetical protein n=1 Tax=Haloplanus salilacus TaxID=2949994 RepID=UPI0030D045DA
MYLLPATPNLTLTVHTTVPPDEEVHLTQRAELVMQATSGGTVFWQRSNPRRATGDDCRWFAGHVDDG